MIFFVNALGFILILTIVWWFWLYERAESDIGRRGAIADIVVDNGIYTPDMIQAPLDESITLRFIRKDPSPCASSVIFPDFGVSAELSLNTPVEITLLPNKAGDYPFTCQMAMYQGILRVK